MTLKTSCVRALTSAWQRPSPFHFCVLNCGSGVRGAESGYQLRAITVIHLLPSPGPPSTFCRAVVSGRLIAYLDSFYRFCPQVYARWLQIIIFPAAVPQLSQRRVMSGMSLFTHAVHIRKLVFTHVGFFGESEDYKWTQCFLKVTASPRKSQINNNWHV